MLNRKFNIITVLLFLTLPSTGTYAQPPDGLGQTIQIYTHLRSFVGRPSWLIIVRDLDHGQNIPYLYDFFRGDNFWLAFTYGRNYLITVSELQFSPLRRDPYCTAKIHNFCNLENGHIMRGESMTIKLAGMLSPDPNTFSCYAMRYPDGYFTIVPSAPPEVVTTVTTTVATPAVATAPIPPPPPSAI